MPSVHQAPSGKWTVRYRDPEGKHRSETKRTKQLADRRLAQVTVELEKGEWRDRAEAKKPFSEVAATWLAAKADLQPGSRANLESILTAHLLPVFGPMQIGRIQPSHVRQWVGEARAHGVGKAALAKSYRTLAAIFEMAVEDRMIPSSPVPKKDAPKHPKHRERRFLTRDQVDLLADVIEPRYRALILTATWSGLRFGELAGLKVQRLDLLRRSIDVAEQIVEVRGKLHESEPKTDAGRRKVEVPKALVPILEEHLGRWVTGEYVFGSESGPLRQSTFSRGPWKQAVSAAGLDGLTFHSLRHTHAALSIQAGANVLALSRRLGHAKPSLTLDVYSHLFDSADSEIAASLDRLWSQAL